ncbi:MAG: hypothetical protein COZ68_12860, partial [Deltaproteobacteria bacterium CG_4_8_14_3_um_filter_43_13]
LVLDPKGHIIEDAYGEDEKVVIADLRASDLIKVRKSKMGFFLSRRRPEIYGELSVSRVAPTILTSDPLDFS